MHGFVSRLMPDLKDRVQLYRGQDPIYDTYGVEVEINKCLAQKSGSRAEAI